MKMEGETYRRLVKRVHAMLQLYDCMYFSAYSFRHYLFKAVSVQLAEDPLFGGLTLVVLSLSFAGELRQDLHLNLNFIV